MTGTVFAAGLALGADPARADDLDVSPSLVRPGQPVTVSGGCQTTDRYVNITGGARGKGVVNDGWFSVTAMPTKNRYGRYGITAKCITSNYSQTGAFRIGVRHRERERERHFHHHPYGGAMTGGGGTQRPGAPWTGLGLVALAGATAIGGTALRRTRAARGRA
ncbi:hypothetical protein DZF91_22805 [Actinomadura logoneensis]|uniref:Uncharacterized protein n=1 Tax=Actinomadura logoneensis TaxID=2293572 RepID=A0A372JHD0_9ACTN|nr:hypothetical protein [Actinomadura logoneensis]RFU39360.1 hypothetical protein DZF91_22805 [Actinomadura logoneensis]